MQRESATWPLNSPMRFPVPSRGVERGGVALAVGCRGGQADSASVRCGMTSKVRYPEQRAASTSGATPRRRGVCLLLSLALAVALGLGFSSRYLVVADAQGSSTAGQLSIVAGNGSFGEPTPGPATQSALGYPGAVAMDAAGELYIADSEDQVIEEVAPSGTLSIVAGTGTEGWPTPGRATQSDLAYPSGVAVDAAGDLYIAELREQHDREGHPFGDALHRGRPLQQSVLRRA